LTTLRIKTPRVYVPLLKPARYKGAWGGRGSGKSHFFAEMLVEECILKPGTRAVCIREVQKTLKDSSKRLIEDKIEALGLGSEFEVMHDSIKTPGNGVITFIGMQDSNAESVKSLENFRIAWCEEAQVLSSRSLMLLRPTIRSPGSELWFSWNARRKSDPVDMLLRGAELPTGAVVVKANWRDNPYFPTVLEQERLDCKKLQPDQYDHVWEGGYATLLTGAYYAASINQARNDGRIGRVAADPLLPYKLFVDIGGTGSQSDAFCIWVAQDVGKEVRVLDYYEAQGQPLATHLQWLRDKGYNQSRCQLYLPHDGVQMDKVYAVSYESALRGAGYDVTVIKNQGRGAAMARVEALRRLFPSCWFNEQTTAPGIDALGWYHEKQDENRQIGLGPEHDWASHGADAAGLMAIVLQESMSAGSWDRATDQKLQEWQGRSHTDQVGYRRAR
jgi:phage terminase large subunit